MFTGIVTDMGRPIGPARRELRKGRKGPGGADAVMAPALPQRRTRGGP